jgi:hypothetical protein
VRSEAARVLAALMMPHGIATPEERFTNELNKSKKNPFSTAVVVVVVVVVVVQVIFESLLGLIRGASTQ